MFSLFNFRGLRFPILLGTFLFLFALRCYAQAPETNALPKAEGPAISLRDAIGFALEANPTLAGQQFALGAAASRIDQAALHPPIELDAEAENILGTNRLSATDDAEVTLRLGTVVEIGDKRARRMDSASSERDLLVNQNTAESLDLLAEVARRFIRVAMLQEQFDLAARRLELAKRTNEGVRQRVRAARSARLESRNAAVAVSRALIEQSQAASKLRQAWAQLVSLWSGNCAETGRVRADLFAMPAVADFAALASLIKQNPDIIRFASETRIQDARLRLAQSQRSPDVTVSAGLRRLQAEGSNAVVLSASIPLGTASRAVPYVSEAASLRDSVQYKEQARRAELLATLFVAAEQAKQSRAEVDSLLKQAVPAASEAQKLAEEGYNVGRFSLLELITAQQQLTDLQRQAIDAAASFHESLLEIERLTGRSAADRDTSNNAGKP